jgi:oxygen-independent coproporphyrinogen-3 oxidase
MSGIYLHIPFCEKKCIYCDFYSVENLNLLSDFAELIVKEIEIFKSESEFVDDAIFDTIYFGGGTPSLLEPSQFEKILNSLFKNFKILTNAEITVETNPGTVDKRKLIEFRKTGINRISFGVQSFFDDDLTFLGRIHTSEDALNCVKFAFESGFENVSVDLIFGLPGQDKNKWLANLEKTIELNIPHVSAYNLIVERGTPLYELVKFGKVKIPDDDKQAELYELTIEFFENAGYKHYEVSNFAKDGFECRHNLKYWQYENYIGFGPSAHSFWINKRWWNVANLEKYVKAINSDKLPIANFEILNKEKMIEEFIYLGLRSTGIDLKKFKNKFGFDFLCLEIIDEINELKNLNFIVVEENFVKLTRKGFMLCDKIAVDIISKINYALR